MALLRTCLFPRNKPFSTCLRQIQGSNVVKSTLIYYQKGNEYVSKNCHAMKRRYFSTLPYVKKSSSNCNKVQFVVSEYLPGVWSSYHPALLTWHRLGSRSVGTSSTLQALSGSSKTHSPQQVQEDENDHKLPEDNSAWLVRLNTENSYLSWCRNVYIATVVGATIQLQHQVPLSSEVAFLFFFMGGLNLLFGSTSYILNLLRIRRHMNVSRLNTSVSILMALLHLTLWFSAIILYLGYVQDDDVQELPDGTQIKGYVIDVKSKSDEA